MLLEREDLTGQIIAAAIAAHRELGPGYIESIYENALIIEIQARGLKAEFQREIPVCYKGHEVGRHRLDALVEDTIIVELKAVKALEDIHFAQVRSYLKACGKQHGLLLNFAKLKLEPKRVIYMDGYERPSPGFLGSLLISLFSFFC